MMTHRKPMNSIREIFRVPLLIGLASTVGLASALLGDGVWDAVSWITLAVPVVLGGYYWLQRAG